MFKNICLYFILVSIFFALFGIQITIDYANFGRPTGILEYLHDIFNILKIVNAPMLFIFLFEILRKKFVSKLFSFCNIIVFIFSILFHFLLFIAILSILIVGVDSDYKIYENQDYQKNKGNFVEGCVEYCQNYFPTNFNNTYNFAINTKYGTILYYAIIAVDKTSLKKMLKTKEEKIKEIIDGKKIYRYYDLSLMYKVGDFKKYNFYILDNDKNTQGFMISKNEDEIVFFCSSENLEN